MENKHLGPSDSGAENHGLESLQRSSNSLTPVSLGANNNPAPSSQSTPSPSGSSTPNPLNLPPKKKSFLKKRSTLVAAAMLGLTLILGLFALRLFSSVKKNADGADVLATYQEAKLQALGVVKSEAVPLGTQKVSINGDLIVNEGIALSPDAINTISNNLIFKVNLNPAANGPTQAGNIAVSGVVLASTFQGNGSNLSNLNASALTSGTVSNDRLDPSITRLGQVIPISALSTGVITTINGVASNAGNIAIEAGEGLTLINDPTNNKITLASTTSGGDITGVIAGTGLTGGGDSGDVTLNLDSGVVTLQGNTFNGVSQLVQTDGSGALPVLSGNNLTNLNASSIASGTLSDGRLSANVTTQGNTFNGSNNLVKLNGAGELPVLSAINLTNLNATNIVAGTLDDIRLSSNVTLQGNTFNLANKLVKLDSSGNLPALNGSAITSLNANNLGSGTVNDARLSANVALLGANQTFSGNVVFSQPLTVNTIQPSASMIIGATNQSLTLQGDLSTKLTATNAGNKVSLGFAGTPTGNVIYNLDAATSPGTYTLCTTVGNCASSGGGVTTLGGTTGKLTRFTGSQSIGDSSISDTGSLVTVAANGLFKAGADSTTAFRVQQAATSNNVFTVDTANTRVAIGQATAAYPLDVAGDINSTTGIRVGGNLVCDSTGCAAGSGSGFYIQNGTALQTAANLNIESANTGSPTVVLKAKTSQTADLLDAKDSSGATVASIDTAGNINTSGQYRVNGTQISSTNLSNNANLAKLDGAQTFTAANTFKNAADSTAAFRIQNAAGSNTVLSADTSNNRVAIGKATAGYTLDVNGDVNINGGSSYRINGVAICGPTATCAPSSGSDGYIQNGLTLQTANFNIQSAQASGIVGIVQGAIGQTADLLQARDSNNAVLAKITSTGAIYQGTSQVCDASNNCGYATSSGSGNYIQNGTTSQTANMNIKSASSNSVTSNIQGTTGQTANIFQVQDGTAQGNNLMTVNQTSNNLLNNGGFETDSTGWAGHGGGTISRTTSQAYSGDAGLQIVTTTAGDGARFPVSLASSTQYTLSVWYKTTNSAFTGIDLGYSLNGVSLTNCNVNLTINNYWGRITCTFTTGATSGSPFIFIRQSTTSSARTFQIDAVQLETGATATAYQPGTIALNGVITSPTILKNQSDSASAFQVQNAAGTSMLNVNTGSGNGIVGVNADLNVTSLNSTTAFTVGSSTGGTLLNATTTSSGGRVAINSSIGANAFSVNNSSVSGSGASVFDVSSTNVNLITNPSFETSTNPWAVLGSTPTISRSNTEKYSGAWSLMPTTSGAASDGVKIPYSLLASTTYSFSVYMKASGSNFSTLEIGYSPDTTTQTSCLTAQTVTTSVWTRYTCTFTTGTVSGTAGNRFVYIKMTDAVARTFYADAAQLELGSAATSYSPGTISLNGIINSPTIFQNQSDSTNAFQIQNAAGDKVLAIDTTVTNLVTNSSFESDTSGWTAKGGATIARSTAQKYVGDSSLAVTYSTASGDGASFAYALAPSTTYSLSMQVYVPVANGQYSSPMYSSDGTTTTPCSNNTPLLNTWQRITCTFTTSTVSGTTYVGFSKSFGSSGTMYVDAVQLELGSIPTTYRSAGISINGLITSPLAIQAATNSSTALTVRATDGTRVFGVDTSTNGINANNITADYGLNLRAGSGGYVALQSQGGASTYLSASGSAVTISPNGNSTFAVQSSTSASTVIGADMTPSTTNLITNPSFDANTTGWAITAGGTSINRITTDQYSGTGSIRDTNTATANTGGKFNYQLAASTTYSFSLYAKAEGSNFSTFEIGYNTDGTTYTSCLTAQTVTTAGWARYTCTFTMPSTVSSTRFVYFRQTDATARSFLIDAVQLEVAASPTNYNLGNISLNGVVNSPTIFKNQSDSTSAFQIQNAAGDKLLSIDSTSSNLITNSSFETNTSGWAAKGAATIARSTTQKYIGDASMALTSTTGASDGVAYNYALAPSTTYAFSVYFKRTANQGFVMGYSVDGSTDTTCNNTVNYNLTYWTRQACTFTTGATISGTPYIYIKGSSLNYAETDYIDAVQLEQSATVSQYQQAAISLNGIINSPLQLRNTTDSTNAFSVQNAAGATQLSVSSATGTLCVGASCTTGPGQSANNLQLTSTSLKLEGSSSNFFPASLTSSGNSAALSLYTDGNGETFGVNTNAAYIAKIQGTSALGARVDLAVTGAVTQTADVFQVQGGNTASSVLSVGQNNANLISNPSFDTATTGWANFTGATLSRITSDQYSGTGSLSVVNTATAAAGAKITYALAASTTYSFSLYAKATGSNFATFQIGYSADGATNTSCLTAQTVTTTGWTRYTCTFTTTTVSGTRYVYFAQTDGTARTFYVDAVQLEAAAAPTNYNLGNISLNGTITSPTTFQNQSNSTTALQIQNTAGTNVLSVDTVNNTVKATNLLATSSQLNIGSTSTQQQFNPGTISQFGTVNFMDSTQNNQVLTVNSTTTGVNLAGLGSNFSTGTGGMTADGGATFTRSTVEQYSGAGSLRVVTTGAANDGVKLGAAWVGGLLNSTTYTLSVYAKATTSNFNTFQIGHSNDGTTYTSCLTAQTVITTAWQRYSCTFTTAASGSGRFIYFRQTDANGRTFYLDAIQLESGSVATGYSEGTITANGIFNSPAVFKNGSDSTTAFQIQNAAGTNLLTANTAGSALVVGTGLQVADAGVSKQSSGTLAIGTSVNGGNVAISAASGFGTIISSLTTNAAIDVLRVGSDNTANLSNTSGTATGITVNPIFQPASGSGNFVGVNINPTINQTGSATGDYTALRIRPTVTAATGTNKLLIDAGTALNTGQLTMTDSGQFTLKNATDSTTAFDIQNSSGVSILSVDSTNMKVTVKDLAITGHIITTGSAPGVAVGSGIGTSPGTPTISGNDTAGQVTIISGTTPTADGAMATITFNAAFAVAPKGVLFTPLNADSVAAGVFVTNIGTSSLTVRLHAPADGKSYQYSYLIVQ